MDSRLPNDDEDDGKLTFQNLMPEKPANTFQKYIIRMQDNWPPHWNKRYLFVLFAVLSGLLIFFLIFESMHTLKQPNSTTNITQNNSTIGPPFPYGNVIYVVVTQTINNTGQLEALNAKTGKLVWNYPPQNVKEINLFDNILYIQTGMSIVALNANTRVQLWENRTISDTIIVWQTDQGILFFETTSGIVTALNASTGAQLWQAKQPSIFWKVDNGIFYSTPKSNLGLTALDAHDGQQLWNNPNIYQTLAIDDNNFYLQNDENKSVQAFDGRTGKIHWQINTNGKDFGLYAQNGLLLLSDVKGTQVEALNSQTGKLLWQRQGTLNHPIDEKPNQIVISSLQNNETDIIRTSDGSTLYRISKANNSLEDSPHIESLFSIANGIAFFIYATQQYSVQYTDPKIIAVRISNGAAIWNSQPFSDIPLLHNGTIDMVINHNSLLSLRADDGYMLWKYTFNMARN